MTKVKKNHKKDSTEDIQTGNLEDNVRNFSHQPHKKSHRSEVKKVQKTKKY